MERKLKGLRLLVILSLVLNAVTLAALVQQSAEVTKTRQGLLDMNRRAEDAIMHLAPELDARMKKLDAAFASIGEETDKMDTRIHQSEDRFVKRLEVEFPRVADQYFNQKLRTLRESVK